MEAIPNTRTRYYLNVFNVDPKAEFSDIRAAFKDANIAKIYTVGVTRKIYDLEFASKKDLLTAAEKASPTILGHPFYFRTSLKNTAPPKSETTEYPKKDYYQRENRPARRTDGRAEDSYGSRPDKFERKPRRFNARDDKQEYTQKKPADEYVPRRDKQSDTVQSSKGDYQESRGYNQDRRQPKEYTQESEYKPRMDRGEKRQDYKKGTDSRYQPKDYPMDSQYRQKTEGGDKKGNEIREQAREFPQDSQYKPKTDRGDRREDRQKDSEVRDQGYSQLEKSSGYRQEGQPKNRAEYAEDKTEDKFRNNRGGRHKKPDQKAQPPKEQKLKLTTLDPQEVINQQRASKGKGKQTFTTPNIFELLEVSD